MTAGTIYLHTDHLSCEVVVSPETRQCILDAKSAVESAGFRVEADAPCIGNFAVMLASECDLDDLQKIISGEVVEPNIHN
jgi:hypothetical protein